MRHFKFQMVLGGEPDFFLSGEADPAFSVGAEANATRPNGRQGPEWPNQVRIGRRSFLSPSGSY